MKLVYLAPHILLQHFPIECKLGYFGEHATRIGGVRIGKFGGIGPSWCEHAAARKNVDAFADSGEASVEDVFRVASLLGGERARLQTVVHAIK